MATISKTMVIRGEIVGNEDVHVEGKIQGSISLPDHVLELADGARISADVVARVIDVRGEVEGELRATESILLHSGSKMKGDVRAPSIAIEDGSWFCGNIDMDPIDPASVLNTTGTQQPPNSKATDQSEEAA